MTQLTKADIDGLVDSLPRGGDDWVYVFIGDKENTGTLLYHKEVKRALYLAAGLQADGSPRPEKVRMWRVWSDLGVTLTSTDPSTWASVHKIVPGHFIPDAS